MLRNITQYFISSSACVVALVACTDPTLSAPRFDPIVAAQQIEKSTPTLKIKNSELRAGDTVECHAPLPQYDSGAVDENGYHPEAARENVVITFFFYNSARPETAKAVVNGTRPGLVVAKYKLSQGENRPDIQRAHLRIPDRKGEKIFCRVQAHYNGNSATSLFSEEKKIVDTPPTLSVVSGSVLQKRVLPGAPIEKLVLKASDVDGDDIQLSQVKNTCTESISLDSKSSKVTGVVPELLEQRTCEFSVKATTAEASSDEVTLKLDIFNEVVEAVLSGTPSSYSPDNALNVSVTGESVAHYKYALIDQDTLCENAQFSAEWISTSTPITSTLGSDGTKRLCVVGLSANNKPQKLTNATKLDWTKDTVAPMTSLTNSPTALSNATALNVSVGPQDAAFYKYALVSQNTLCENASYLSQWTTTSTPITAAIGADGQKRLCVIGKDLAGNVQSASNATSVDWVNDATPPTATLSNYPAAESTDSSLAVVVGGADVVEYQYSLTSTNIPCQFADYNGSWLAASSPITDSLGSDGDKRLCVIGRDSAGNEQFKQSATSYNWLKDTESPTAVLIDTPINPTNIDELNVTVTGNGVIAYKYAVTDQSTSCSSVTTNLTWTNITSRITDTVTGDGEKRLCVIAKDAAGNTQTLADATVHNWTLDTAAPTAVLSNVPNINSKEPSLNISVSGSQVVNYRFVLTSQSTACSAVIYNGWWTGVGTPISSSSGSDGLKRICVVGRDAAGNEQETATEYNWSLDTIAPSATLSGVPNSESQDTVLDVTVAGSDVTSYQFSLIEGTSSCATAAYNGLWKPLNEKIDVNIGNDGDKKLCVIGRDVSENEQPKASATSYTWEKDSVAPTVTLSNFPIATSNSLAVTVGGADVYEYDFALTTQSTPCNTASYSGTWYNVQTSITESIGSDGTRRLCVIGRDNAGNTQTTSLATVHDWLKDTQPPTALVTSKPTNPAKFSSYTFEIDSSDVVSYKYAVIAQNASCLTATYSGSWVDVSTPVTGNATGDGYHKLCLIGQDGIGNVQPLASATTVSWMVESANPYLVYSTSLFSNEFYRVVLDSTLQLSVNSAAATQYSFSFTKPTEAELEAGPTYTCNATTNWASHTSPLVLSMPDAGIYRLCVTVDDGSQTTYGPYHIKRLVSSATHSDLLAALLEPESSVSGVPSAPTGALSVTLNVTGTGVFGYKYAVVSGATTCNGMSWSTIRASDQSLVINQSSLSDGLVSLCVKGISDLWIEEPDASVTKVTWMKDSSLAQVDLSGELPASFSKVLQFSIDVESSVFTHYVYALLEAGDCTGNPAYSGDVTISNALQLDVTSNSEGPLALCVKGSDGAGAYQAQPTVHSWTKDTIAPTAAATGVPTGSTNVLTHTVNVTSTDKYRFALVSGSTCPLVAGDYSNFLLVSSQINLDTTLILDGDISLCLQGRDNAGNTQDIASVTKYTWVKDTSPATATLSSVPSGESNVTTLSATVGGADVVRYYYNVNSGLDCGTSWTGPNIVATQINDSIAAFADGQVTLCVKGEDQVGNLQEIATKTTWTKDTQAPTDLSVAGEPIGTSNAVSVNITVSSTSAVDYVYTLQASTGSCPSVPTTGHTEIANPISQSIDGLADGTILLCVWGRDAAQNVTDPVSKTWTKQMLTCGATPHGGTTNRTQFLTSTVPYGNTCTSESQTGTCYNGVLSWTGSYTHSSCTVDSPSNCSVNGISITHGQSKTLYTATVASSCSSQVRSCNNGVLSGSTSYIYDTCRTYYNCTLDGVTVNHGNSRAFYSTTVSSSCASYDTTRTCNDGTLSGSSSYQYKSCRAYYNCTVNGTTVNHGTGRTFYSATSNANCANIDLYRTCNDGTISGSSSYQYASCTNCGGAAVGSGCYYQGSANQNCNTVCSSRGGCVASETSLLATDSTTRQTVLQAIRGSASSGSVNCSGLINGVPGFPGIFVMYMSGSGDRPNWATSPQGNACSFNFPATYMNYTNNQLALNNFRPICSCNN